MKTNQVSTTQAKNEEVIRKWHFLDASDKTLGRISTDIATLLMGKHKPNYTNHVNVGDVVVVTNASKIKITGKKLNSKVYKRYTGYPGGVKQETLGRLMDRRPTEALTRAVKGMLPKNKLQNSRMANLHVYEGSDHPHKGQKE